MIQRDRPGLPRHQGRSHRRHRESRHRAPRRVLVRTYRDQLDRHFADARARPAASPRRQLDRRFRGRAGCSWPAYGGRADKVAIVGMACHFQGRPTSSNSGRTCAKERTRWPRPGVAVGRRAPPRRSRREAGGRRQPTERFLEGTSRFDPSYFRDPGVDRDRRRSAGASSGWRCAEGLQTPDGRTGCRISGRRAAGTCSAFSRKTATQRLGNEHHR